MAIRIKRFIEPGDILGLQMECADCKATFSLSFKENLNIRRLSVCPHCQRPWIRMPEGSNAEVAIDDLIRQLNNVGNLLKSGHFKGFRLLLEVASDDEAQQASGGTS